MNYAIILAGGIGSRFWPLSRIQFPKQFIKIKGHYSLLQETVKRIRPVIKDKNIFIITNRAYLYQIKRQIKAFSIPSKNIILEPKALNTAPAISLCANLINVRDRNALLVILPSDHYIEGSARFCQDILKAIEVAKNDFLVTIGIKPRKPNTGYGYIKRGLSLGKGVFTVDSFIEKPTLNKAKKIYRKKGIYWNAGIFCWKASVFLEELKRYQPDMYERIIKVNNKQTINDFWSKIKPISVDYGILEKTKRIALVPAGFIWTDLGSWDALFEILPKDRNKNIILSDCFGLDSKNNIVLSARSKRFIATVGLKNMIIVDTPDALLVCDRNRCQDIKILVEYLKRKKRKECIKMSSL